MMRVDQALLIPGRNNDREPLGFLQSFLEQRDIEVFPFRFDSPYSYDDDQGLRKRLAAMGSDVLLVGHSRGAAAAIRAAEFPTVAGLVALNPIIDLVAYHKRLSTYSKSFAQRFSMGFIPDGSDLDLDLVLANLSPLRFMRKINKPVLTIFGGRDYQVPPEVASESIAGLAREKDSQISTVTVPALGHFFDDVYRGSLESEIVDLIAVWLS